MRRHAFNILDHCDQITCAAVAPEPVGAGEHEKQISVHEGCDECGESQPLYRADGFDAATLRCEPCWRSTFEYGRVHVGEAWETCVDCKQYAEPRCECDTPRGIFEPVPDPELLPAP